jgi:hypothetical protein
MAYFVYGWRESVACFVLRKTKECWIALMAETQQKSRSIVLTVLVIQARRPCVSHNDVSEMMEKRSRQAVVRLYSETPHMNS